MSETKPDKWMSWVALATAAMAVFAAVTTLTKKKPLFYLGVATVSGWIFFFLDAIFLFY